MIQIVKLSKGQILTKSELTNILNSARSTFQYAKISLSNGMYLTINYNKDNTIEIATNTRDLELWNQIQIVKRSYTQARVIEYAFRWINKLNKVGR